MNGERSARRRGLACLLALLGGACGSGDYSGIENAGPFDHLFFRDRTNPPGVAKLSPDSICIQQGIAIKARVSALDADGRPLPVLDLQSDNSTIFVSERGPTLGNYVFYGVEPGSTELIVTSRGRYRATVPVAVSADFEQESCPL